VEKFASFLDFIGGRKGCRRHQDGLGVTLVGNLPSAELVTAGRDNYTYFVLLFSR
jgi:hypothetical protein